MMTRRGFQTRAATVLGLISFVTSLLAAGVAHASVTYVRPGAREQTPGQSAALPAGGFDRTGFLGPGPRGEVLFGYSFDYLGAMLFPDHLWAIGPEGTVLRRLASGDRLLQAADTGGGDTWVAGQRGAYRVEGTDLVPVRYIRIDRDPDTGRLLIATDIKSGESADLCCSSLVVDVEGRPWVYLPWLYELRGLVPPAPGADGINANYAAVRRGGAPIVATRSHARGVWVYTIRRGGAVLEHLDVTGHGLDACIVSLECVGEGQLPGLAAPCMAASLEAGVVVIGQAAHGDRLIRYRNGELSTTSLPAGIFHARHVTALDVGAAGRIYAATDGVGVMVLDETGWQVHPITAHLPTIAGTDLKPVDDILVTEDGTVYAACQTQLIIWRPDGDEE